MRAIAAAVVLISLGLVACGGDVTLVPSLSTGGMGGGAGGAGGEDGSTTGPSSSAEGGAGAAGCGVGETDCAGACVDLMADPDHCGACWTACAPWHACSAGGCACACAVGTSCCGDACVDPSKDPLNCGMCGLACPAPAHATPACAASVCAIDSCDAGYGDCDDDPVNGCETDVLSNVDHCGGCDTGCGFPNSSGYYCWGGGCNPSCCGGPSCDCNGTPVDGCEVNTNLDPKNCGACGIVCAPMEYCVNADCVPA